MCGLGWMRSTLGTLGKGRGGGPGFRVGQELLQYDSAEWKPG